MAYPLRRIEGARPASGLQSVAGDPGLGRCQLASAVTTELPVVLCDATTSRTTRWARGRLRGRTHPTERFRLRPAKYFACPDGEERMSAPGRNLPLKKRVPFAG